MMLSSAFVVLCLAAASDAQGGQAEPTLRVEVLGDNGEPVPFRAYLRNESGALIFPEGVAAFDKKSTHHEQHLLIDRVLEAPLLPGTYHLRVERGMNWYPHEETIELSGDVSRTITLKRFADPNSAGWYTGDLHVHRSPDIIALATLAEDLNFAANISIWNDGNAFENAGLPTPDHAIEVIDATHALCVRGQEVERLGKGWGAVLFVGDFEPVNAPEKQFFPLTNVPVAKAKAQGALIDFEKPVWRATPICAALGLIDTIGLVHNHFHPEVLLNMGMIRDAIVPPPELDMRPREMAGYTLGLYYHLLNCGLRIGASAGSASGVMPSPVGFARVWVKLDEPFSAEAWLDALKAGRSFATNGPVLLLTVNGHEPGATIALKDKKQTLHVRCLAHSQAPLQQIEIIHNGQVVQSLTLENGETEATLEEDVALGPGWVAARCWEPETETQIFAATSPVYLEHEGQGYIVKDSARYYATVIESLIAQAMEENRFEGGELPVALDTLGKARGFYTNLVESGADE